MQGRAARDEAARDGVVLAGRRAGDPVEECGGGDGALLPVRTYQVPGTVGAIAPVQDDEGWLLAAGQGFVHLSPEGVLRPVAETDVPPVLGLNERNVEMLAPMDEARLRELREIADRFDVVDLDGAFAGFVITCGPGTSCEP